MVKDKCLVFSRSWISPDILLHKNGPVSKFQIVNSLLLYCQLLDVKSMYLVILHP